MPDMPLSPAHAVLPNDLDFLRPVVVPDLARFGNSGDGGYVVSAGIVRNVDMLISFGVSNDWSFEEDLTKRNPDLLVHAYDHTISDNYFFNLERRELRATIFGAVKLLLFRLSPNELATRIHNYKACRKTYDSYRRYFTMKNHKHFQERIYNRAEYKSDATIDTVFARAGHSSHIFLKIDIEGAEYRVVRQVLKFADRIDMMVIEFHDTEPLRRIFTDYVNSILCSFNIIHIHGNNYGGIARDGLPEVLEITFLNKRFPTETFCRDKLPLTGLDFPNNPSMLDYTIAW
jgi:FkbM family methyltransferase